MREWAAPLPRPLPSGKQKASRDRRGSEVAKHVTNDEEHQDGTGNGHDHFLADDRCPESPDRMHPNQNALLLVGESDRTKPFWLCVSVYQVLYHRLFHWPSPLF